MRHAFVTVRVPCVEMRRIGRFGPVLALTLVACSATASPSASPPAATATPAPSPTASPPPASDSPSPTPTPGEPTFEVATFPLPAGSGPHDVAPAADGGVWYTAQDSGELGWLDPESGEVREVALGAGSRPHGVIVGPDDAPWITDGGLNAIVRVDPDSDEVEVFPLPASAPDANLNTAAFDGDGVLWFTGQNGWYGRLDPDQRRGGGLRRAARSGPYGITATPEGEIYYSSLAGSYLGEVDRASGEVRVIDPPTAGAGLAPGLVRLAGPAVGQRVGGRPGRRVRPGDRRVAGVAAARRRAAGLLGVRRRGRCRLADRLHGQRDRALRPRHRDVHELPGREPARARCGRCSAAPARSGVPNPRPISWW